MEPNALSEVHTRINDHPMVTKQVWKDFTKGDHNIWKTLFERQSIVLQNRACDEILQGINTLEICNDKIPKLEDLNTILTAKRKSRGLAPVMDSPYVL